MYIIGLQGLPWKEIDIVDYGANSLTESSADLTEAIPARTESIATPLHSEYIVTTVRLDGGRITGDPGHNSCLTAKPNSPVSVNTFRI
jgi:hypothetical protein